MLSWEVARVPQWERLQGQQREPERFWQLMATQRIISNEFKAVEPLFTLALIYLALTSVLVIAQFGLERTFRLKV